MDAIRFDALIRLVSTSPIGRRALSRLAPIALIGLALPGASTAKKKRKKKKKCTGPGFCNYDGGSIGLAATRRWAQTFLPPQGGQLTKVEIGLRSNPLNFPLNVQIRSVDALGVPANTIFGLQTVSVIDSTVFPAIQMAPFTFNPLIPLELGVVYALTVTGGSSSFTIHANNVGNPCSDGTLFADPMAFGQFAEVNNGAADMVYTLTIVA